MDTKCNCIALYHKCFFSNVNVLQLSANTLNLVKLLLSMEVTRAYLKTDVIGTEIFFYIFQSSICSINTDIHFLRSCIWN